MLKKEKIMAKLIKELGNAIGSIAGTTVTVISATGAVVESVANSAVATVNGLAETTSNLSAVSTNFTAELKEDSEYSKAKNTMVNSQRKLALEEVLADKSVMSKLKEAEKQSILEDLFD